MPSLTDKELLELAAKAADYEVRFTSDEVAFRTEIEWCGEWNPLADDGDAFRLAVKLRITVEHWVSVPNSGRITMGDFNDAILFKYGDDAYAATRLAIVHAAAEIGKWK